MPDAYPLEWPEYRKRTPPHQREQARFDTSLARARDGLLRELDLLGANYPVLSTNLTLRLDGLPYANQKEPGDRGVAVYFEYKGRALAFACDRWFRVKDNIQGIRKTIEALRGIARWGTGDMITAAFSGFKALPPAPEDDWREVLGVSATADLAFCEQMYRGLATEAHPDKNGGHDEMARLNGAIKQARVELGG